MSPRRRSALVLATAALLFASSGWFGSAYLDTPQAQVLPVPIEPIPGADPSMACVLERGTSFIQDGPVRHYGFAIKCPVGTLRGFPDLELGTDDPRRPGAINGNISAGNRQRPGYVVVTPDVGKGLIVEDGRLRKLLLVRGERWGGTEFRAPVRFERGLTVCDSAGCVDVLRALRKRG